MHVRWKVRLVLLGLASPPSTLYKQHKKNRCSLMHHLRDIQARRKKLPFNQLIDFPLNQPSNEQAHQCSITMHILHQSWKHRKDYRKTKHCSPNSSSAYGAQGANHVSETRELRSCSPCRCLYLASSWVAQHIRSNLSRIERLPRFILTREIFPL